MLDLDGRPVANALLDFGLGEVKGIAQVRTDAQGAYVLPPDVSRAHRVCCWRKGYYGYRGPWPRDEEAWTIRLRPKARLEGRVLDDRGDAVSFLWVRAESGERVKHERPGSDGRWRIFLRGGTVHLRITSQAGLIAERTVIVRDGESVHWDLVLPPTRTLRPRVLPPPGRAGMTLGLRLFEPLGGALRIDAEDGYLVNDWSTPGQREAALTVPPDEAPYWLVVFHADHDEIPLVVRGPLRGAPEDVTVRVPAARLPSAVVSGRFVEDAEQRESSRIAYLYDEHGFHTGAHVDDESGRFTFDPVPPGRYTLRITSYGGSLLFARVLDLEAGQVRDLGVLR